MLIKKKGSEKLVFRPYSLPASQEEMKTINFR